MRASKMPARKAYSYMLELLEPKVFLLIIPSYVFPRGLFMKRVLTKGKPKLLKEVVVYLGSLH